MKPVSFLLLMTSSYTKKRAYASTNQERGRELEQYDGES
jgi:hypothetical protein